MLKDGERVVVDKSLPCRTGDLVVYYLRPEIMKDGGNNGFMKVLAMAPPSWVTFPCRENPKSEVRSVMQMRMLNPAGTFWVKCEHVLAMYRVVGVERGGAAKNHVDMTKVVPCEQIMAEEAERRRSPATAPVPLAEPVQRSLMVYDKAPADCRAHLVKDDRFAPQLWAGEVAVIDERDREPAEDEIFLVTISSPREPEGFVRKLMQPYSARSWGIGLEDSWMIAFSIRRQYSRKLSTDEIADKLSTGEMTLSDGPISDKGMRDKIIGRVVGVILPEGAR